MYLYVRKANGLSQVPEALLTMFGKATLFGSMLITADKKLARADATQVLTDIAEKGFICKCLHREKTICLICFAPTKVSINSSR